MGLVDSNVDSQIELSKIFLTALLGFITIQNYIKKLLQRKEKKHERNQKTHARCRPRKFSGEKVVNTQIYTNMTIKRGILEVRYERLHAQDLSSDQVHGRSTSNVVCRRLVRVCF